MRPLILFMKDLTFSPLLPFWFPLNVSSLPRDYLAGDLFPWNVLLIVDLVQDLPLSSFVCYCDLKNRFKDARSVCLKTRNRVHISL